MKKVVKESELNDYIYKMVLNELSYEKLNQAATKANNMNDSYQSFAENMTIDEAIEYLNEIASNVENSGRASKYANMLSDIKNFIQRKLDQQSNLENGNSEFDSKLRNSIDKKLPGEDDFDNAYLDKFHIGDDERKQKYGLSDDELYYLDNDY